MGLLEIILIAIGLSMDAFAVSITLGLSVKKLKIKHLLIPAIYFGFFQALMPLIGYLAGINFVSKIQNLDHWIAFALLILIGGKMIKESFSKEKEKIKENPFRFLKMLLLAVATSIDALAVGITFAFFEVSILSTILIVGFTTFCISAIGVKIANIFGTKYKAKAEFIGGGVLIILGFKILIEHLIIN
jgi:putative Mn2+ efflux pump MntP